jgi:hypothetical protein
MLSQECHDFGLFFTGISIYITCFWGGYKSSPAKHDFFLVFQKLLSFLLHIIIADGTFNTLAVHWEHFDFASYSVAKPLITASSFHKFCSLSFPRKGIQTFSNVKFSKLLPTSSSTVILIFYFDCYGLPCIKISISILPLYNKSSPKPLCLK